MLEYADACATFGMVLSKNEKKNVEKYIEQNFLSYFINFGIISAERNNNTWNS